MDVLGHNRQVLDMIISHWPAARIEPSPDCISIRIRLPQHTPNPKANQPDLAIGQNARPKLLRADKPAGPRHGSGCLPCQGNASEAIGTARNA
jgi:hypothetical protein